MITLNLTQEQIRALSDSEKKELRQELIAVFKELNTSPRSDWHAGFEAYLKVDARNAEGGTAEVIVEHSLGEEPPRIDFIVWLHDEGIRLNKQIYNIFRRFNVIEYKNPRDNLNWRVIHKAIGYANLYIGLAENEGDRPKEQVTISIFRAVKNPELFKELEDKGYLVPDEEKGIYHVKGITEFPFQIVIMTELEGDEYAAARAMIDGDRASVEDIQKVVEAIETEEDEVVRNHLRVVLNLISDKNPEKMDELVRRDASMSDKLFEICKSRIDKEKKKDLFIYVQDGQMTPEYAAGRASQPVAEFITEMKQNGYSVPARATVSAQ